VKKIYDFLYITKRLNGNIEGDELIVDHATQYYKNLFGPSDNINLQLDPSCWNPGEKFRRKKTLS
jgi:hypothetical protein